MTNLNLTFGIELEFICLRTDHIFEETFKESEHTGTVGPALYSHLLNAGIPATGWESLDDDIVDNAPTYSQWRVETDILYLSRGEGDLLPEGWESEAVELSSRKFNFFTDDWRSEISAVLQVLRDIENQYGCRFITNKSTGFHVHVGNDTEKVPLRVAKNVFQLATAFERCLDELHTAPRIEMPEEFVYGHCYYPPSFFHACSDQLENVTWNSSLFNRLANIENVASYGELVEMFKVFRPELGQQYPTTGHNSAINFDNLFTERPYLNDDDLTGTIEFRQHTGSLDYIEIVAWVLLTCQIVKFCADVPEDDMLDLCLRAVDMTFKLEDFLLAIDCGEDVMDHYLNHGPTIGVVGTTTNELPSGDPLLEFIIAQNDDECDQRGDQEAVEAAIQSKFQRGLYGIDLTVTADIPPGAARAELQKATVTVQMSGVDHTAEAGISKARAQVFRGLAQMYKCGEQGTHLPLDPFLELN